jgi:multicomponent Na+:H+ antiporter subunit B
VRTVVYVLAAALLCALPLLDQAITLPAATSIVASIARETAVPNVVSGIILNTRLYDTVGEVVVFSLAALGVKRLLSGEAPARSILAMEDAPSLVLCQLGRGSPVVPPSACW